MKKTEAQKRIVIWTNEALELSSSLEKQKKHIHSNIEKDVGVKDVLWDFALEEMGYARLYSVRHQAKQKLIKDCVKACGKVPNKPKVSKEAHVKFHKTLEKTILDEFLCGDKCIGDCTREEVQKQADWHRATGDGHIVAADVFDSIATKIKSKTATVRESMKAEVVMEIVNKYHSKLKALSLVA